MAFINGATPFAEAMGHHPDIHLTKYKEIYVEVFTHDPEGLTGLDFQLASELDTIPIEYSPKWLKENPPKK